MLYEIRTYRTKPGAVAEIERAAAGQTPPEGAAGPLAFWHTEIGPLNEIVRIAETDGRARQGPLWPAIDGDLVVGEEAEIWWPAPFMRPLEAGEYGGVFEMRTYTYRPGTLPNVLEVWARAVPARERLSPLVACWYTEVGAHRFRHVWAYRGLDERARIRKEALAIPGWPPLTREWRVAEENEILHPASFSPVR